ACYWSCILSLHDALPILAWGGRAVAESAAGSLAIELAGSEHVGGKLGIRKHDAAQADHVDPAGADHGLRDVRQIVLQVRVRRAEDRKSTRLNSSHDQISY